MAINSTREDEDLKESLKLDVLKRLLKNLLEYRGKIVLVTGLILVTVAIQTTYPLLIEKVIDDEIIDGNVRGLFTMAGFMIVLAFVNYAATRIWRRIMAVISNDMIMNIRRRLWLISILLTKQTLTVRSLYCQQAAVKPILRLFGF